MPTKMGPAGLYLWVLCASFPNMFFCSAIIAVYLATRMSKLV